MACTTITADQVDTVILTEKITKDMISERRGISVSKEYKSVYDEAFFFQRSIVFWFHQVKAIHHIGARQVEAVPQFI